MPCVTLYLCLGMGFGNGIKLEANAVSQVSMKPMLFKVKILSFSLLLLLPLLLAGTARSDDCVYTVYIRTGSIFKGGTDSNISLKLYDSYGYGIHIQNLEVWGGLMDAGHDYFERGNLDIFSGRGPCLNGGVCAVNLTSDGSGEHHGWYCNYVEVTSTGAHIPCAQRLFTVEQWLALDAWPYKLWAHIDLCPNTLHLRGHPSGEDDGIITSGMPS